MNSVFLYIEFKNLTKNLIIMRKLLLSFAFAITLTSVMATSYTWNGGSSTWSTTTNWTPNGTPGSGDDVTINSASAITITLGAITTVNSLTVSGGSTVSFAGAYAFTINSGFTFSGGTKLSLTTTSAFTLGNGTLTFSLTGNDASNYFTGTSANGYLAVNNSASGTVNLYVDPAFTWYNFVIQKGTTILKSNCGTSRLGLSSLNSQKLQLDNNVTFTLNGTGSSSLGLNSASTAGYVDASATGSKFVFSGNGNAGASVFAGTNKIFASAATVNSLEINVPNGAYTPNTALKVNTLTLTAGNINNTTNNITILNAGTIKRASQTAFLAAAPIFGLTGTDKVSIQYTGTCTTGNELFGTTGSISSITVSDGVTATLSNSSVTSIALSSISGTNFTTPTITIAAPTSSNGVQATATCFTTGSGSAKTLLSICITNPGYGYTSAPTVTITDATGSATGTPSVMAQTGTDNIDALSIGGGTSGVVTYPNTSNKVVTLNLKDITVNSGATFICGTQTNNVSHLLNLSGSVVNNGTFTPFTSAGKVIDLTLNGSTLQSLGGITLNNVTLNNSAGVSLTGATVINAVLTLTSGKISLGSNDLTIAASGSISGASASSYIITDGTGKLNMPATAGVDLLMPIGSSASNYDPATVNAASQTTFAAKVYGALSGTAIYGVVYNPIEWQLIPTAGSITTISLKPSTLNTRVSSSPVIGIYDTTNSIYTNYNSPLVSLNTGTYSGSFDLSTTTSLNIVTGSNVDVTGLNKSETGGLNMYTDHNQLMISGLTAGDVIALYGLNGQLLKSFVASASQSTNSLPQGGYIVKIHTATDTKISKVIVN